MSLTSTTKYTATITTAHGSWTSDGASTSASITLPNSENRSSIYGGQNPYATATNIGYVTIAGYKLYPAHAGLPSQAYGSYANVNTVANGGTVKTISESSGTSNGYPYYFFGFNGASSYSGSVSVASRVIYSGTRSLSVECGADGVLITPAATSGQTITGVTESDDADAHSNAYTAQAALIGSPNTGTLGAQGNTAATFLRWYISSGSSEITLATSGDTGSSGITGSIATVGWAAGTGNAKIFAEYVKGVNSSTVWKPALTSGKVMIHILDSTLTETTTSRLTAWSTLKTNRFSSVKCASGGVTVTWSSSNTSSAYLNNVSSAVFTVVPLTGWSVYAWKHETATGVYTEHGASTSVTMSGFTDASIIHLYLTSATALPKLVYDGFDSTTSGAIVPADQSLIVNGVSFPVGSEWVAGTVDGITITGTPTAWAIRTPVSQSRAMIENSGTTYLSRAPGAAISVASGTGNYTTNRFKFRVMPNALGGSLRVAFSNSTADPALGAYLTVVQQGIVLRERALATSGGVTTVPYYYDDVDNTAKLDVTFEVDYAGEASSDYVAGITRTDVYAVMYGSMDGAVEFPTAHLTAYGGSLQGYARTVVYALSQIVNLGSLSAVKMMLSHDNGATLGSEIATGASSASCYAGSVAVAYTPGQVSSLPITVTCAPAAGFSLAKLLITSTDGTTVYSTTAVSSGTYQIVVPFAEAQDDFDFAVTLVACGNEIPRPSVQAMTPSDAGKFTYTLVSDGGYDVFRTGDSVTLTVTPPVGTGGYMPGVAIGSPKYNGVELVPVRDGVGIEVSVMLTAATNVFEIPVYAVLTTAVSPGTISPTLVTTWDVDDTLTIDAVEYQRIGSIYTIDAPSPSSGYTLISGTVETRANSGAFGYVVARTDTPAVSATGGTFEGTLTTVTKLTAVYAQGASHPYLTLAAYDYVSESYIVSGVRPTVSTTAVSPTVLTENVLADITWPESSPGEDYEQAAYLARQVDSSNLLAQVTVAITSSTGARLEMWSTAINDWVHYASATVRLVDAFNYFRTATGTPPQNKVTVEILAAVNEDGETVEGGKVYVTSPGEFDGLYSLGSQFSVPSRTLLYLRLVAPLGYTVAGWQVNLDPLDSKGASVTVAVPDDGLIIQPIVKIGAQTATTVGILNGSRDEFDEGVWVSKLFRSQWPWKPVTAVVVAEPFDQPVMLTLLKSNTATVPIPSQIDELAPEVVQINVLDSRMRRLPAGEIQRTRFMRYMLTLNGDTSVSSVAIASGAETLKGGH